MLRGQRERPLNSPSNTRAIFLDLGVIILETASTSYLCE
jgi:hypothetical protein